MINGIGNSIWIVVFVFSVLQWIPVQANAVTYDVTVTEDILHGFCDPLVHGCSLRDAVLAANANPGAHEIHIPPGVYELTIPGVGEDEGLTGDLDVKKTVFIHGSGDGVTIIDALGGDRVFEVHQGVAEVAFYDLTIRGGNSSLDPSSTHGGGIASRSDLTWVGNCIFDNNETAGGYGGGLFVEEGVTEVYASTFRGNTSSGGSAIAAFQGRLSVDRSAIVDNYATDLNLIGTGGAIWATLSIVGVHNSTIAMNRSRLSNQPSGIYIAGGDPSIKSSTLADNKDDDVFYDPGGLGEPLILENNVIRGTCNDYSVISTLGGNVEGPGDSCGLDVWTDLIGVNVSLRPLGNYGGVYGTPTMPPVSEPGNVIIDNQLADLHCYGSDQRHMSRPYDGDGDGQATCDSGAVEYHGVIFGDGFQSGGTGSWSGAQP